MRAYTKTGVSAALIILSAGSLGFAQQSTSQIKGTVQDVTGSAVPGAVVKATQTKTGNSRTVTSAADGGYVLTNLPIGPYEIEVSKDGFTKYVQSGITLQVDSNPTIDIALKVGAVTEQVVVRADAAMVETHNTGVGQVVDQERVVDLPLNGRQASQLILLAGEANVGRTYSSTGGGQLTYPTETNIAVGGGQSNTIAYLLDGGTYNDPWENAGIPLPFPDVLQEFKVETGALPAQYGYHATAAVNAVTKSGGNSFHGDAFEFVRNGDFNARDTFALSRDSLKRNQYGGTVGGPIRKDKLFFFVGYQGTILRSNPSTNLAYVPTSAELAGNFSLVAGPGCNSGKTITLSPAYGFVNNQILQSLLSPPSVKLASLFPVTNDPCGKVQFGSPNNQDEQQGVARIDYQVSSKHSIFGRYFITHLEQPPGDAAKDPLLSGSTAGLSALDHSLTLGDTYIIGSGTVNAFRASLNRAGLQRFPESYISPCGLGVQMYCLPSPAPQFLYLQTVNATGSGGINLTNVPANYLTNTIEAADDVNWVRGAHQIGFGADFIQVRGLSSQDGSIDGRFLFYGQATGLSIADLMVGAATSLQQNAPDVNNPRQNHVGLYIRDTWKMTPKLTLNAGVRWEPNLSQYSPYRGVVSQFSMANFLNGTTSTIFPNAPAGMLFDGDAGGLSNHYYNSTIAVFAPRLGLAWDPFGDGKTVIRAAYGIYYDGPQMYDGNPGAQAPLGNTVIISGINWANPWANYPGGNPFPSSVSKNSTFPLAGVYMYYGTDVKPTYIHQWNFVVQKQVGANWLLTANYLGMEGMHLWTDQQINPGIYVPGNSTIANINNRRVLSLINSNVGQYYSFVNLLNAGGTSSYNALLFSAQHRLANHFTVLANYTWAHCITDNVSAGVGIGGGTTSYSDPTYRGLDRGNCASQDHRQVGVVSLVAESPSFSQRWLRVFASGWKLSGILTAQTGGWFAVSSGSDTAFSGQSGQHANYVSGDPYAAVQNTAHWLNPTAFTTPPPGSYGDVASGSLLGPGSFNIDLGLSRIFRIRESQQLEARAEAFNSLNHVNWNNPATTLSSAGTFGTITSDAGPRLMQFALKYVF